MTVEIRDIQDIENGSPATPQLWNSRFAIVKQNFANIRTRFVATPQMSQAGTGKAVAQEDNAGQALSLFAASPGNYTFKTNGKVIAGNVEVSEVKSSYSDNDLVPLKYIRDHFSAGGSGGGGGSSGGSGTPAVGVVPNIQVAAVSVGFAANADVRRTGPDENPTFTFSIPRGAPGPKGDPGTNAVQPTFSVGAVRTLDPSQPAAVNITGTPEAPVFNFSIPRGATGPAGTSGGGGGSGGGSNDALEAATVNADVGSGGHHPTPFHQVAAKRTPVLFRYGLYALQSNLTMRSPNSVITRGFLSHLIYRNQSNTSPWQDSGPINFGGPINIPTGSTFQGELRVPNIRITGNQNTTLGEPVAPDGVPTFKHLNQLLGFNDNTGDWSNIYNDRRENVFLTFTNRTIFRDINNRGSKVDVLTIGRLRSDPLTSGVEFNNAPYVAYGHSDFTFPNGKDSANLVDGNGLNHRKRIVTVGVLQVLIEWVFTTSGFRVFDENNITPGGDHASVFGSDGQSAPAGKILGFKLPRWLGGHGIVMMRVTNCPFGKLATVGIPSGFSEINWTGTAHASEAITVGVDSTGSVLTMRLAKLYGTNDGTVACTFIGLGK